MGKAAQEAVKDRVVEVGSCNAGAVGGFADLLLMMPALGEFACGIKPVERGGFSGPAYIEERGREGVEGLVEVGALMAGGFHQIDQDLRTEAAVDGDTFTVEAIDEVDDVLLRGDVRLLDEAAIANHGELAESGVEEMRGYVANCPSGCEGLQVPFFGAEVAQEIDEPGVDSAEKRSAEDGFGAGDLVGHGRWRLW